MIKANMLTINKEKALNDAAKAGKIEDVAPQ
jgi:hypothetical protein